jgi:hypothetical protein
MQEHEWEKHAWDYWEHDSDEDMSEQEKAAFEFVELLLEEYLSGTITAATFCILCFWANAAGLVSAAAARYGIPPGRASGKYKDHLDEQLHFRQQRRHMYHFQVPGRQRRSEERCAVTFAARHSYS